MSPAYGFALSLTNRKTNTGMAVSLAKKKLMGKSAILGTS
jgi:hypothetical protein